MAVSGLTERQREPANVHHEVVPPTSSKAAAAILARGAATRPRSFRQGFDEMPTHRQAGAAAKLGVAVYPHMLRACGYQLGGRQKGTPNKPVSVKIAMKAFTDERGAELMAFAERVLFGLPDIAPAGEKGYVNFIPAKIAEPRRRRRYDLRAVARGRARTRS